MKLLWVLLFTTVAVSLADNGMLCSLCTELITSIEDEIQDDEGDIIKKANGICDKITKKNNFLDPICKQIFDLAIENVLDDLKNKEDPQKVCATLQFCKAN